MEEANKDKVTERVNPFANATQEVKNCIDEKVRQQLATKEITFNQAKQNKELWKLLDTGTSMSNFYRLIGSPSSLRDEPSRRTYIKVCKRLGIALDESRHPLALK